MEFDAYKYSKTFERLACKIVEKEISNRVLVSGITKCTRDEGIDAIIQTENDCITIEAKLRKPTTNLGLKDIASSVIFYLLRVNNQHYIVTNVYLTSGTIEVLDKINLNNAYDIKYIDGECTLNIINSIFDDLTEEEQYLATLIIDNFTKIKKCNSTRSINRRNISQNNIPVASHKKLQNLIISQFDEGRKCIVLSGKIGTGKSTIVEKVIMQLSDCHNTLFVNCSKHNTIEAFMYQISNAQIGIDINMLINEYINSSKEIQERANQLKLVSTDTYSALIQILNETQMYTDNIHFLAETYIEQVIELFSTNEVFLVLDNYSDSTAELGAFLSHYIFSSSTKLRFLIVVETDMHTKANQHLIEVLKSPLNNYDYIKLNCDELNPSEANKYIECICDKITEDNQRTLYEYFGGNILLLTMAIHEMKKTNNYNVSMLRPYNYEEICKIKLHEYVSGDNIYLHSFFVCWLMNSKLSLKYISYLGGIQKYNLLKETDFFNENKNGLEIKNAYIRRVIFEFLIFNSDFLRERIEELADMIYPDLQTIISQIRLKFFIKSSDFVDFTNQKIAILKNKSEHEYIIESRLYLYLYYYSKEIYDIQRIESMANLIYDTIDSDHSYVQSMINIDDLEAELERALFYVEGYFNTLCHYEKIKFSRSKIKYNIYLYFKYKRKGNLKKAKECLYVNDLFLSLCSDGLLTSKIIRFRAICKKEEGNRKEFMSILEEGVKQYPDNEYLVATYYANVAASKYWDEPFEALDILENNALPLAEKTDDYLHLWLLNDKLICWILCNKNMDMFENERKVVLSKAERLCSATDKARAENTFGAYILKQSYEIDVAKNHFKNAFYKMLENEPNYIMFYFASNYIQTISKDNKAEYIRVADLMFDWCKKNVPFIQQKINDPFCVNKNNKLQAALYSFAETLQKYYATQYDALIQIPELNWLKKTPITFNNTFNIGKYRIILF